MPSDRYDCGNIDFCNDGDKLHSIKTLEDFMSEKILLIDGHSILNRAFYGLPDLTNSEGKHTGAVYGFLNILLRTIEEEKPQYLTVAFDLKAPTFRLSLIHIWSVRPVQRNFRMEQIHRISSGQPERKLQQTQMKAKG